MQVGLEDRHGEGQMKMGHDHTFDRGLAQHFIKIAIEAVLSLGHSVTPYFLRVR